MSLSIITVSQRAAPALLGIVGIYATRGMRVASSRGFASTTHNNIKMTNGSLQSRRHMSNIPINTNAHDHHKHSAPQAETITMQHIAEKLGQVAGDVRELRGDVVRLKGQQPAQAAAETPPQRDWAAEWRSKLYDLNDDYQALKTVVAKTKTDMHAAANAAAGSASAAESASRVEAAAAAATAAAQASSSSSSSSSSTASHPYAEWHRQYDKNRWQSHCGAKRGLWGWIKIAFIAYAGYHVTKAVFGMLFDGFTQKRRRQIDDIVARDGKVTRKELEKMRKEVREELEGVRRVVSNNGGGGGGGSVQNAEIVIRPVRS